MPSLPRNPPIRSRLDERIRSPLSSAQSRYECRAEVIITHAPSTSDACEMHAQPVEKSIASLALRALLTLRLIPSAMTTLLLFVA
jgi:hypothetical protein